MSRPHYITALLKNSMKDVPILQTGTGDQGDIFGQLLSVLNGNGPLGGAGVVLKDELDEGKLTLVTRYFFLFTHICKFDSLCSLLYQTLDTENN